ncbi:MAG: GNAT family N-acetyltransferase [Methylocystis sp.]|uniref:GNAT family N-acetyltransferase n=1 Tax=Methylocystis sp. TaxID=1911079 RepID=UPI003DA52828
MTREVFSLSRDGFVLEARLAPWDADAFGFPVAQITRIDVKASERAEKEYGAFQSWVSANDVRIVSCRLSHERLAASMFLEDRGFRFIEMVLHPQFEALQKRNLPDEALAVVPALDRDLPALQAIAEQAFRHERYHMDPRLDPRLADKRYGRWVRASFNHPTQQLLKIVDGQQIIGVFVVEMDRGSRVHWHLTAIAPDFQGKGYGRRTWLSMLRYHRDKGAIMITTTISARNVRVLNLYSRLSARFLPPEMTFHWVRPTE